MSRSYKRVVEIELDVDLDDEVERWKDAQPSKHARRNRHGSHAFRAMKKQADDGELANDRKHWFEDMDWDRPTINRAALKDVSRPHSR